MQGQNKNNQGNEDEEQGGRDSSGQFQKGSEKARESGRKGGSR